MRIPTLDGPRVQQAAMPTPYSNLDNSTGAEELGRAIGQAGQQIQEALVKAQEKKDAADIADAEAELQHRWTSRLVGNEEGPDGQPTPGFLSLNGRAAADAGPDTLEQMQADRAQIAGKLANENQRRLFNLRTGALYEDQRRRVLSHVSQQIQVAEEASLRGRAQEALKAIADDYTNEKSVELQTATVEGPIRALQLSEEDGNAKISKWRANVAETRLNQYLNARDWKGAENLFSRVQGDLDPDARKVFTKAIASTKRDGVADGIAQELVSQFQGEDGRVDTEAALQKLDDSVKDDVAIRDEARQRFKQYVLEHDAAWKRQTDEISKKAYSAYNTGGWRGIPAELKDELNARNPELYHQLKNETERKFRERGTDSAAARREQAEIDRVVKNDFLSLPTDVQAATDLDEYLAGRGASLGMSSELKVHKRIANDRVTKGEASTEKQFVDEALASSQGVVKGKDAQKDLRAEALLEFRRFTEQHKRPPNKKEAAELTGTLLQTKIEPGLIYDSEVLEFERRAKARRKGILNPETYSPPTKSPGQSSSTPPASPPPGANASPSVNTARPALADRYRQLKRSGKSAAEIAATLNAEGYTKESP